jgi:hypothetical protein
MVEGKANLPDLAAAGLVSCIESDGVYREVAFASYHYTRQLLLLHLEAKRSILDATNHC